MSKEGKETASERNGAAGRGWVSRRLRRFSQRGWWQILRRVATNVDQQNLSVVAAGVAFFGLLSIFPMLAAVITIYGLAANPADVQALLAKIHRLVPDEVHQIIQGQLQWLVARTSVSLSIGAAIATATALWTASEGTKALMQAMNIVYGEKEERGFLRHNGLALLLTLGGVALAVVALVSVVLVPALLGHLGSGEAVAGLISVARWPLLLVMVWFALIVLYRYGPDREQPGWRWIWPGAAVATVLWVIASFLFSCYVSNFGSFNETYGSLGAGVILLFWSFLTGFIVLLGVQLNAEMERQDASENLATGTAVER